MNMSCLQPFLVLSLAAMSRKKEKEDVDMEEEEEEEEWEEDGPWKIPREGRLVGAPPLGLGKPEELPSKPRGW